MTWSRSRISIAPSSLTSLEQSAGVSSHSSGMPLLSLSSLVPSWMSQLSGTPFLLQSSEPCARSMESGMPLSLQSVIAKISTRIPPASTPSWPAWPGLAPPLPLGPTSTRLSSTQCSLSVFDQMPTLGPPPPPPPWPPSPPVPPSPPSPPIPESSWPSPPSRPSDPLPPKPPEPPMPPVPPPVVVICTLRSVATIESMIKTPAEAPPFSPP